MDRNLFENMKKIDVGVTPQPVKDWKERYTTAVKPGTFCIVETKMGPKILYRNTMSQTFVTWPRKIDDGRIVGVPNRSWIKEAIAEYFADPKAFMTKVAECDVPGTMHPQETPDIKAEDSSMEDYSETDDPSKLKDKTKENEELAGREVKDKELEQKPPETKESKVKEDNYRHDPEPRPESYKDEEGDTVYILPDVEFTDIKSTVRDALAHGYESFLYGRLGSGDGIANKDKTKVFWGADVQDHLPNRRDESRKTPVQKPPETKESKVNERSYWVLADEEGRVNPIIKMLKDGGARNIYANRVQGQYEIHFEHDDAEALRDLKMDVKKDGYKIVGESKRTPRQKPRGYRIRESLRFCGSCNKTFRSNESKCQCGNEKTEVLGEREYSDMVGSEKPVFKVEYVQDGQKKEDRVTAFDEDDAKRYVERMKRGAKATKAVKVSEGLAAKSGKHPEDFDKDQLEAGTKVEMEHTDNPDQARQIAMDHLTEDPAYYTKLKKMESGACDEAEAASKLDHDLTIKGGKGTCKCGKWEYENADAARVKANFQRHVRGKPNLFRSNTLGRDVTIPENESVSPSATIDQLAEEYAKRIASKNKEGIKEENVHETTVGMWVDFNNLVAMKLKDKHGITVTETKVNESQQRRARDQAVEIMERAGIEAWGVDDYKIRVAMNEKVAIEMTVDGYYERQQKKADEGKVPDDADAEDKKVQKLYENVTELLDEMPDLTPEDRAAVKRAIASGAMSDEWPTDDEMIDQLSALEDIVDPEGLDPDVDIRMAWLQYVAVPKALTMAESKVDEVNLNEPAGFESCVERGGRVRTISGPDKEHGLKAGEYVKYCYIGDKSFRGEVETKKSESKVVEQGPVSAPGQMPPIPNKPAPGQKPESPEEKKKRDALASAAAKAVEGMGDEELSAYAEQIKKRQQGHK